MVRFKSVLNHLAYAIALLGFVPLFTYLEPVPRLLFPAALAAGIVVDRKDRPVKGRLPTVISILFFFFYAGRISGENLVAPSVNLLVVLLAVRLVSEKSARNYLQIYALALFSLAGSSLFSLSALFLGYFLLMLVLIAVSLVILTFHSASAAPAVPSAGMRKILSAALLLPAASLPLILLFFFVLPRTQYPLWNFLNVGGAKTTGFSEKVAPGTASSVGEVRNVAFRARCRELPGNLLYWRGIVLNAFEGDAWVRRDPPAPEEGIARKGEAVTQTIFPEAGRVPFLLALNVPRGISGIRHGAEPDRVFVRKGAPGGHEKYEVVSVPGAAVMPGKGFDPAFYLKLPGRLSRRMAAFGRSIAERGKSDSEKVRLMEEHFRNARLSYGTSALPVGEEPLDQFLFDKKNGNCGFFASSFALLLRCAGVPARLVGGYHGGNYNELGGYYAVTEDMAHVWVEAFITGKGWVTIDPTRWAVNFSGTGQREKGVARTVAMAIDALGYYWNLAVINYDLERQVRLISGANSGLKRLTSQVRIGRPALVPLVAAICTVAPLVLIMRKRTSPEERILRAFFREVRRKYGVEPGPAMGLHGLAATLNDPCADRFAAVYGGALYRDRRLAPDEIRELKNLVRGLRGRNGGRAKWPAHKP